MNRTTSIVLAAGASLSLESNTGGRPLEYNSGMIWCQGKHVLPFLLRFGAPLPRSSYCHWMKESDTSGLARARRQYVAKVRAAGSWAAYEKAHTMRLVTVFEKIFPRPRLPHEIASHVVRFCFHTGYY